jgi:pimeloyl-ACP methyl ester carboxylesterase
MVTERDLVSARSGRGPTARRAALWKERLEMGRMLTGTVTTESGTPVAYWRSGKGPPLVLVHGTAADHSRWSPVLPALEERFTVNAIDRRGRGGSGDTDDYPVEREFEDVAAVVDSLGEPVNLLGHSYGGLLALEAALLTIPRELRAIKSYRLDPQRFEGLGTPTLVLSGDDSPAALRKAAEAVDRALSDSHHVVMEGEGHSAMDTGTDLFTAEDLNFLDATRVGD